MVFCICLTLNEVNAEILDHITVRPNECVHKPLELRVPVDAGNDTVAPDRVFVTPLLSSS